MEKLICPACGAPLTPDTSRPFLTCEYCDTPVENKFFAEPAVKEPEPEAETVVFEAADEAEETHSGPSLLQTILGVGTAIAASNLRRRTTIQRQPVIHTSPLGHAPVKRTHQRTLHAMPRRHPEPPRTGGMGMRPMRPGMNRPMGGPGGRGPSGRGGMSGPGGRHR